MSDYLDSDCPLGSRPPHDPCHVEGSGAISWLLLGMVAIGWLLWWACS